MTTKLNGEFKLISGKLFYVMQGNGRYVRIRCISEAWHDWYAEGWRQREFIQGLGHQAHTIRAA